MPGRIFDDDGRLRIPEMKHGSDADKTPEVVINAVYCPNGHNLISTEHRVSGYPAILVRFEGIRSGKGLLALSAILGDTGYCVVEGSIDLKEPVRMTCNECGTPLDVLGSCHCDPDAVSVMAYLYPNKDPHQAIAFCNILSCPNSALIRSGEYIKRFSKIRYSG